MSLLNSLLSPRSNPVARELNHGSALTHTVKPAHEVKEVDDAWNVTVYLPGVNKEGLELTAEEGRLRIAGRRAWKQPEGWTAFYRESADAAYELVLTHDNAVKLDAITAEIRDGVLRVSVPKHEALKPRKIEVK